MNRLDPQRLTMLRLDRGLASRQLALDCGIDITVLNRLESHGDASLSTVSLAQFLRLADRLNVPARMLLTDDQPEAEPDEEDDPRHLGALLTELGNHTQLLIVADALDWTVTRVHAAADALASLLEPAGLTVFRDSGRISIRPLGDEHQQATITVKQDPRLPYSQRVVTPARAQQVYKALHGKLSEHAFSTEDRRHYVILKRVGLLDYESDRRIVPTDDVLRSLYPEGQPDDQATRSQGSS